MKANSNFIPFKHSKNSFIEIKLKTGVLSLPQKRLPNKRAGDIIKMP
jgi:hypothetical protein